MEIKISEYTSGAMDAEGLTVIIDVFRAFSVACYAFDGGVKRLIDVGTPDEAFALRSELKSETILAGERDEKMIAGFDAGNSPTEILQMRLSGKTIIHTTTAGTNGILSATGATEILGASLVNAAATARYIMEKKPAKVTLVAMGYRAETSADEDILCAGYIRDMILGLSPDIRKETETLRHTSGKRFFDPVNLRHSPPSDFFLCTNIDRFDFVIRAVKNADGYAELFRIDI